MEKNPGESDSQEFMGALGDFKKKGEQIDTASRIGHDGTVEFYKTEDEAIAATKEEHENL